MRCEIVWRNCLTCGWRARLPVQPAPLEFLPFWNRTRAVGFVKIETAQCTGQTNWG